MNRRDFLKALGVGGLAVAAPALIEPTRKLWFVSSTAPVGSRVERLDPLPYTVDSARPSEAWLKEIDSYVTRDLQARSRRAIEWMQREKAAYRESSLVNPGCPQSSTQWKPDPQYTVDPWPRLARLEPQMREALLQSGIHWTRPESAERELLVPYIVDAEGYAVSRLDGPACILPPSVWLKT